MKRKIFVVIMIAILLLIGLGGEAQAENQGEQQGTFIYKDFRFAYDADGTICIIKYLGGEKVVQVPAEIDGVPVRHLGEVFSYNDKITKVYLPEGIEEITGFSHCRGLREVNIPKSTKVICYGAFSGCRRLQKIELPDGLHTIKGYAFSECKSLKEVIIPDSVNKIGLGAFACCTNLQKVVLPKGLTRINNSTFSRCEELKSISLPKKLQAIGNFAFSDCINLKKITIPKNVRKIGTFAFNRCIDLKKITVKGTKIRTIGDCAFDGISNKAIFDVPNKIRNQFSQKLRTSKENKKKMWKVV